MSPFQVSYWVYSLSYRRGINVLIWYVDSYTGMIHNILYFRGLDKKQAVLLTHGDSVEKVAENFKCIANSSTTIAGIANEKAHIYGLQFHPEVG